MVSSAGLDGSVKNFFDKRGRKILDVVKDAIDSFKGASFTLKGLVSKVAPKLGFSPSDEFALCLRDILFASDLYDDLIVMEKSQPGGELETTCVDRSLCLGDAQVAVRLMKEELEGGFFILGHRILPFADFIDCGECRLFFKDKPLVLKDVQAPLSCVLSARMLFGESAQPMLLALKNPDAIDLLGDERALSDKVNVEAFDLAPLRELDGGRVPERFVLRPRSLKKKTFDLLEDGSSLESRLSDSLEWINRMDKALSGVCSACGDELGIASQIEQAFLVDGGWLKSHPILSLGEYLGKTPSFEFHEGDEDNPFSFFWPKGETPPAPKKDCPAEAHSGFLPGLAPETEFDEFAEDEEFDLPETEDDALEYMLDALDFSLSAATVKSYMLDELAFGPGILENAIRRAFRSRFDEILDYDAETRNRLFGLLAVVWMDAKALHAGGTLRKLNDARRVLLKAKDKMLAFLRILNKTCPDVAAAKSLLESDDGKLSQMDAMLDDYLDLLTADPDFSLKEVRKGLKQLNSMLPLIEPMMDKLLESMDSIVAEKAIALAKAPEPPRKDLRSAVHVFETSWRGAKRNDPKKKIELLGSLAFDDLACAIVDAWELDDDHLYKFWLHPSGKFKDRWDKNSDSLSILCPGDGEDEPPWLPADGVSISELFLAPGSELAFLHDYGDENWFKVKYKGLKT